WLWVLGLVVIKVNEDRFFLFGCEDLIFSTNHCSICFSVKGLLASQISKINFFNSLVKLSRVSFVMSCDLFRLPFFSFTPNFKNPPPRFLNEIMPASALWIGI